MNSSMRWVRAMGLGLGAFAAAVVALAGVDQWTSSGPAGVQIYSFGVDPSDPSRVFALGTTGLFRSKNGGASWANVNALDSGLYALTVAPASPLYALHAYTDVARSDDDGSTWQYFQPDLPADDTPTSLAIDPSSGSTLYLGTNTGVFKSTNGGETWAVTGLSARSVYALAVDPSKPATVYAATVGLNGPPGGVYKTTDAGRNWVLAGSLTAVVTCLAIDPTRPATIYGCVDSGIVRSVDGGATWPTFLAGNTPYAIAIEPGNSSRIYAATYSGLFRGDLAMDASSAVRFGPEAREDLNVAAIAVLPSSPPAILAAGRNAILRSTDGGDNWAVAESGGRAAIGALAVDPSNPGLVYAGGSGGVFKSASSGAVWSEADLSTPTAFALAADPKGRSTLYAGGFGASKSSNGGASWEPARDGLAPGIGSVTSLAVAPSDPSVILAGALYLLFRSTDGGAHWKQTGLLPQVDVEYPPVVSSVAFDPSNPSIAYAAGDIYYYFGGVGGVFKTVDAGAHWVDLGVGRSGALSVVVDPVSPSKVYAATRDGVIKSVDAGATWIALDGPTGVRLLVIDPAAPTTMYSGGDAGVFQSLDAGATWAPLAPGLNGSVTSLAIDSAGERIHAGTGNGVFDYDLSPGHQGPCTSTSSSLCLLGGRFRVSFSATDPHKVRTSSGLAVAQSDRFGYFSLPDFTGDGTLPEVFVKMVDGSWLPHGSFWVFYNGLTNLPYTIVVTDTTTGARRVYHNDGLCGAADTSAFPVETPTPKEVIAAGISATTLTASGNELLLLDGRFRVMLSATDPRDGQVSEGSAIAQSDRFGYFSLPDFTGDPNFPEVCVKMVDATSFTGEFWFFHSGLTSLPYTLTVTDTVTGAVRTYQNGSSGAARFCGGADTRAFSSR